MEENREPRSAADLVARARAGDRTAEAEIVERYSAGLLHLLRHMTRDPALADDLHQETFRLVLEKLRAGQLADPEKLSAFLRGTARNLFLGGIRKTRRQERRLEEGQGGMAPPESSQLGTMLRGEEAALVRRLLAEMRSERDREILFRFYLAEEDRASVREELGLTPLQFNRVLHRSRQRFRELWERATVAEESPS